MQWYFVENGAAVGPFDLTQLEAMAASGRFRRDSQSCRVGASEWIDASEATANRRKALRRTRDSDQAIS